MTTSRPLRGRLARAVVVAAVGATSVALAVPAAQAADNTTGFAPTAQNAATAALTATGLNHQQAMDKLRAQGRGMAMAGELTNRLGDRAAGFFLEARSGEPVVNVLDAAAADRVRAAGATARVVRHSTAELAGAKATLDGLTVPNTARGIDPTTNQVVLTVSDAATGTDALLATAKNMGGLVRVQRVHGAFRQEVAGGDEITTGRIICSAGFNVNDGTQDFVITAGHCTEGLPNWNIGPSVDSSFPDTDFGLIRNDTGDAPGVVNLYDGTFQSIGRAAGATVGESVCKSGRTTQVTCGVVQALDQTVDFGGGDVVHGMIQTNVHAEPGDSGGSLFDGSTALGMVSGGNSTTTFFQPVTTAINTYGVSLN